VLAEFGEDPRRYADGRARRNYAGTSPVTRASGKKKVVAARFVHNDRLTDALHAQAQSALTVSPGARTFYDQQRARGHEHNDALRRLANRLVGILHGCLKTGTPLQRGNRLGPPREPSPISRRSLTPKPQGCLCRVPAHSCLRPTRPAVNNSSCTQFSGQASKCRLWLLD
jgi:transposase IS116/IS110/IS902 family protein